MKHPLKTLEANLLGRDFVVGDIHGSYSAFKNLFQNLNFNPDVDRIISVGDLVDRGPDSLSCLSLIREKWFHSVLANHEQMMVCKFNGNWMGGYWFQNGGEWGMEAWNDYNSVYNKHTPGRIPSNKSMELIELLPLVEELPFLITINTKSGKKFHVLHAELPAAAGPITDDILADPEKVFKLATIQRGDGDAFLWTRNVFGQFYAANLQNLKKIARTCRQCNLEMFNDELSHIISGHTVLQKPMTIVGQTNIDTYAYKMYPPVVVPYGPSYEKPPEWAALTCVELDTWKFYQATATEFRTIDPVVISEDDIV